MDPPWRGTIAPEMGTEMSTLAFLFSSETKFLYGAGGCVEVWASSCSPQIINLDENDGFRIVITDIISSMLVVCLIEILMAGPLWRSGQKLQV